MAFDLDSFNNVSSGAAKGPKIWSYGSTTDDLATIGASGYFDEVSYRLSFQDLIYISASDGTEELVVSSASDATPVTSSVYSTAGGGGSSVLTQLSVPVSSAQLLDFDANPILLVTSPGPNSYFVLHSYAVEFNYGGIAYSGGDPVFIAYGITADVWASTGILANKFYATADKMLRGYVDTTVSTAAIADVIDRDIYFYMGSNFLDGNSSVVVHITYEIVTTSF